MLCLLPPAHGRHPPLQKSKKLVLQPPWFFPSSLSRCLLPASQPLPFLSKGSFLSTEDRSTVLISPSKSFSAGFYEVGNNAYTFSIWFTHSTNKTVSWTANRDRPINGHRSRLTFSSNGNMALIVLDGTVVWSTNTGSSKAVSARLLDTGNLVPYRNTCPTLDTSEFYFDDSNVLRMTYNGPEVSSVYWPNPDQDVWANGRNIYNSSRYAVLDDMGKFLASDEFSFTAVDAGSPSIKRRLTPDYDGNLRLYSLRKLGCGPFHGKLFLISARFMGYGEEWYLRFSPRLQCSCPPGYEMSDPSNWSMGCKPWFNLSCDTKTEDMEFMSLPYTDFWGFDFSAAKLISFGECKKMCLSDCRCQGFHINQGTGLCYGKTVLYNGRTTPLIHVYIKVPKSSANIKSAKPDVHGLICNSTKVVSVVGSSERCLGRPLRALFGCTSTAVWQQSL
ncbi:hypothetical protein HPP92_012258 [Vanilla planifolia]|uniref:Bulb-type lectin domain-containing protein n=1 Tax=Vanilla planifolia TaxID=51239 RepID=A0A835QWK3_VANPL|nr:hypothetical protein HPP92_012258 [Vanilla planifolia]